MKALFFAILGIFSVIGVGYITIGEASEAEKLELKAASFDGRSTYRPAVVTDTITNAEKDTLAIAPNFLTNYQLSVNVVRTSLSGTYNVKMYLDESNLTTGTSDWHVIDSTSTTSATVGTIYRPLLYQVRYRVRLAGTGTQSSRYQMSITAKPIY